MEGNDGEEAECFLSANYIFQYSFFSYNSTTTNSTVGTMLSLVLMIIFLQLAIHLINTVGATSIDSLVGCLSLAGSSKLH